jgi:hypothetical protein
MLINFHPTAGCPISEYSSPHKLKLVPTHISKHVCFYRNGNFVTMCPLYYRGSPLRMKNEITLLRITEDVEICIFSRSAVHACRFSFMWQCHSHLLLRTSYLCKQLYYIMVFILIYYDLPSSLNLMVYLFTID